MFKKWIRNILILQRERNNAFLRVKIPNEAERFFLLKTLEL